MDALFTFRALNSFDLLSDPEKNGLASKQLYYDLTEKYLETRESKFLETLKEKERKQYIKDNIPNYIKSHSVNLEKKFIKGNKQVHGTITKFYLEKDQQSYYYLLQYLSTLNNHLINGFHTYTNWISTTKDFDSMWRYYDAQDEHKVAAIYTQTNGICSSDTFVVDVSDKKIIDQIKCLGKTIKKEEVDAFIQLMLETDNMCRANEFFHEYHFQRTKLHSRGYSNSTKSKEVCIYNFIRPESIVAILEQLQIDLIRGDIFDNEYFVLSKQEQKYELEKLKCILRQFSRLQSDPYFMYVFEQLYVKNVNISKIAGDKKEEEKLESYRLKILRKALTNPSRLVKKL